LIRQALTGQALDIHFALEKCDKCDASLSFSSAFWANRLRTIQNDLVARYCRNVFICDDVTCAFRSRRLTLVQQNRDGAVCPRCHSGILRREMSCKALFDQQRFFRSIFDYPTALRSCTMEQTKKLQTRSDRVIFAELYSNLLTICDEFLSANGYNVVDLSFLFAPMMR